MADMPRQFFRLPVQPRARLLLALLWSYAPGRRQAGERVFVWQDATRLAECLDVGKRAVESCLEQLYAVGVLESGTHNSRKGYWLVDGPAGAPGDSDEVPAASSAPYRSDRRSPITPVQIRSEIADHSGAEVIGDLRSHLHGTPIRSARVKEELEELEEKPRAAAAAALSSSSPSGFGHADLVGSARQILAEVGAAFQPRDATGQILRSRQLVASDRRTVELLAQLLEVTVTGEDRAAALAERRGYVRAQIEAFASVCARDPEQARWWGPGMLSLEVRGRVSPWAALEATVETAQRAAAEVSAAQAAARLEAQARRAESEREAATLASGRISSPAAFADLAAASSSRFGADLAATLTRRMTPEPSVDELLEAHRRKVEQLKRAGMRET